jgi:hypothetical protein
MRVNPGAECGPGLYHCRCQNTGWIVRTAEQVALLHKEAVYRAHLSGWANEPVPLNVVRALLP